METDTGGDLAARSKRPREASWTQPELDALKASVHDLLGRGRLIPWTELANRWQQVNGAFPSRSASSLKHKWVRMKSVAASQVQGPGAAGASMTHVSKEEHDALLQKLHELQNTISTLTASVQLSQVQHTTTSQTSSAPSREVVATQDREHDSEHKTRHLIVYIHGENLTSSRVSAVILADALQVMLQNR